MSKVKITATIFRQDEIALDVFSMVIIAPEIAKDSKAGQFLSLYSKDGSKILPRPISICEVDKDNGTIRLVYRILGAGTLEFSHLVAGDTIDVLGPLGNGFTKEGTKAILIGGGIGIPPMLQLAKELDIEKTAVLGYRDELFLSEDFIPHANLVIASESGKFGIKGTVIDAIKKNAVEGDIIFACGPTPMLKAIKEYAMEKGIEAQLSLEEKMACGIGACLACVCNSTEVDSHSMVKNKRICKDGPVFYAKEVEF